MTSKDTRLLSHFITRMGMYICPCDRHGVVSFITGYEIGRGKHCCFTALLSRELAIKYKVRAYATGWPDQVARFSDKRGIDWMQGFMLIAAQVIAQALRVKEETRAIRRIGVK